MSFYSSIYTGKYFLFLLNVDDMHPINLMFRDSVNGKKESGLKIRSRRWRTKVYLYKEILQRKWIEYKYKDRFFNSVKFDNRAPLIFHHPNTVKYNDNFDIKIESVDSFYKLIEILIEDVKSEKTLLEYKLKNIQPGKFRIITVNIKNPGIYMLSYRYNDETVYKGKIIVYKNKDLNISNSEKIYCVNCLSDVSFYKSEIIDRYQYINYIPFNDLLDTQNYSQDFINSYIMSLTYSREKKSGLVHLLNIIRLSNVKDEINIVTNLFKDDPAFAYFITNRLFISEMIPILPDYDLQEIFRKMKDELLGKMFYISSREVRDKILKNISRRKADDIKTIIDKFNNSDEKVSIAGEVNKFIRNYFVEKYGRLLKIPVEDMLVYRECNNTEDRCVVLHGKDFMTFDGKNIHIFNISNNKALVFNECIKYDIESRLESIFNVTAVNDYSIVIKSSFKIFYGKIHIYDWKSNLEDIVVIENIDDKTAIPIGYFGSVTIMTIGVIDYKNMPHEQVLKVAIKD